MTPVGSRPVRLHPALVPHRAVACASSPECGRSRPGVRRLPPAAAGRPRRLHPRCRPHGRRCPGCAAIACACRREPCGGSASGAEEGIARRRFGSRHPVDPTAGSCAPRRRKCARTVNRHLPEDTDPGMACRSPTRHLVDDLRLSSGSTVEAPDQSGGTPCRRSCSLSWPRRWVLSCWAWCWPLSGARWAAQGPDASGHRRSAVAGSSPSAAAPRRLPVERRGRRSPTFHAAGRRPV
jgi:hypothetical protein